MTLFIYRPLDLHVFSSGQVPIIVATHLGNSCLPVYGTFYLFTDVNLCIFYFVVDGVLDLIV